MFGENKAAGLPKGKTSHEFDGHTFNSSFEAVYTMLLMIVLYIAKRAMTGDNVAKEVLEAFNVTIYDMDNKQYYPQIATVTVEASELNAGNIILKDNT